MLSRLLHIAALNLSEIDQKVFEVAVKIICDEKAAHYLTIINDISAEILVIDGDTDDGQQKLQQTNSNHVKIVLSSGTVSGKNIVSLPKPVRVLTLKDIIEKVSEQLYTYISNNLNDDSDTTVTTSQQAALTEESQTELHSQSESLFQREFNL